jgi:probable DNA repair protein
MQSPPSDFIAALRAGQRLITPSARHRRLLSSRYALAQKHPRAVSWETPRITTVDRWLAELFEAACLAGSAFESEVFLLSRDQERYLWEHIIADDGEYGTRQVEYLARSAMGAWQIEQFWGLDVADLRRLPSGDELQAFLRWRGSFIGRCETVGAFDRSRFLRRLGERTSRVDYDLTRADRFYGFVELPPAPAAVQAQLAAAQPKTATGAGGGNDTTAVTRVFPDPDREASHVAAWAANLQRATPDAAIVVAAASLATDRDRLARVFARAFAGAEIDGSAVPQYVLEQQQRLVDMPIIAAALLVVGAAQTWSWGDVSQLLLSPYLGSAIEERGARIRLDVALREGGRSEYRLDDVTAACQASQPPCVDMAARLRDVGALNATAPRRQSFHGWMQHIDSLLTTFGWPGAGDCRDHERHAVDQWHQVIDSVASLDAFGVSPSWREALSRLRSALRRARFHEPQIAANVTVVTPEEALWLQPDHLWVMGMTDRAWPPSVGLNPLLPTQLQRALGIAGADPERDRVRTRFMTNALLAAAPRPTFSFAAVDADVPRRGGPMIPWDRDVPDNTTVARVDEQPPRVPLPLEVIDDSCGPHPPQDGALLSGVALLTDQAACPFRAFARHRLDARGLVDPGVGLDPAARGDLVHRVLAELWAGLDGSQALAEMEERQLTATLEGHIERLRPSIVARYHLSDAYWRLEAARLSDLVGEWLALERQRPDFEVLACEREEVVEIAPYRLTIRIDRIDRLADGRQLIIDYKTGLNSRATWSIPRPDQPQLPIYALNRGADEVAGIAFATVRKGQSRWVDHPAGIATGHCKADAEDAWRVAHAEWRAAITELIDEYRTGVAVVDPKRGRVSCEYCDLQALCRVRELGRVAALGADDAA